MGLENGRYYSRIVADKYCKYSLLYRQLTNDIQISQIAFSHIFVAFDSPAFGLPLLLVVNFFFLATYESGYLHPVSYVPQFPQVVDAVQEVRVDIVFESIGRCITRAFLTSNPWS